MPKPLDRRSGGHWQSREAVRPAGTRAGSPASAGKDPTPGGWSPQATLALTPWSATPTRPSTPLLWSPGWMWWSAACNVARARIMSASFEHILAAAAAEQRFRGAVHHHHRLRRHVSLAREAAAESDRSKGRFSGPYEAAVTSSCATNATCPRRSRACWCEPLVAALTDKPAQEGRTEPCLADERHVRQADPAR